jgi:transposase InsO family protein
MIYAFILEHTPRFTVRLMTRLLKVSSGYYAWLKRLEKPSVQAEENTGLLEDIRTVYNASQASYGNPRVHATLRQQGTRVGRYRVARLMRSAGLQGKSHRRKRLKTTDSNHDHPRASNHLDQMFKASHTDLI